MTATPQRGLARLGLIPGHLYSVGRIVGLLETAASLPL